MFLAKTFFVDRHGDEPLRRRRPCLARGDVLAVTSGNRQIRSIPLAIDRERSTILTMFKWYVIFLLGTVIGGWCVYPYAYPVLTKTVARGRLPAIDWDKLKPGSLATPDKTAARTPGSGTPLRTRSLAPADRRFDAVVIIEGGARRAAGCIVKPKDTYYIVTSQHALAGNRKLTIRDGSGREYRGAKMLAAKSADVAMIEIDSPPPELPFIPIAANVASVAKLKDEIMLAGDSQGVGTIKVSVGTLQAIAPVFLDLKVKVPRELRGGPVFHTASGSLIGILAEATKASPGGNLRGARAARGTTSVGADETIRYLGHRLDTITGWDVLDWDDFQAASAAAATARSELNMVAAFVEGDAGYGQLQELKSAVQRAEMTMANKSLARADREKALGELLRIAGSITDRRLIQLKNTRRYHIHQQDLRELSALATRIKSEIARAESEGTDFALRHGLRM